MKKVMILAVVAALLGISAPTFAQVPGSSQPSSTQEDDRNQDAQPNKDNQSTQPSNQSTQPNAPGTQSETEKSVGTSTKQGTESMASEYTTEVKSTDLPAEITRSLNEKYPGFKTDKAMVGADGTYKVKVSKGEEKQVLFFDARGQAIKIQK